MKKFWSYLFAVLVTLAAISSARAQMLGSSANNEVPDTKSDSEPEKTEPLRQDPDMTADEEQEIINRLQKDLNPRMKDGNLVINPVDLGKTDDGSKRGTVAFISTNTNKGDEEGNIFLYYSNFQILRTAASGIRCRVRFHLLNGLNRRINNVSVKLVWPGLNTPVSFNNVDPNTENYFDYALFGDGCYQMDKIPNIVVNRCRVKGMSQESCANKIRWLAKR